MLKYVYDSNGNSSDIQNNNMWTFYPMVKAPVNPIGMNLPFPSKLDVPTLYIGFADSESGIIQRATTLDEFFVMIMSWCNARKEKMQIGRNKCLRCRSNDYGDIGTWFLTSDCVMTAFYICLQACGYKDDEIKILDFFFKRSFPDIYTNIFAEPNYVYWEDADADELPSQNETGIDPAFAAFAEEAGIKIGPAAKRKLDPDADLDIMRDIIMSPDPEQRCAELNVDWPEAAEVAEKFKGRGYQRITVYNGGEGSGTEVTQHTATLADLYSVITGLDKIANTQARDSSFRMRNAGPAVRHDVQHDPTTNLPE